MDLALRPEQEEIRELVRDVVRRDVRQDMEPSDALATLAELGLLGLLVSEGHGGAGLDAVTLMIVLEELARGSASLAAVTAAHVAVATDAVALLGSDAQRQEVLPKLATGEWLGALAWREAAGAPVTVAADADGHILSGRKMLVANATRAGLLVTVAEPSSGPQMVFAIPADAAGVAVSAPLATLGLDGLGFADVELVDCNCRPEWVLQGGRAHAAPLRPLLARADLAAAAVAVGVAHGAMSDALQYALDRRQFGRRIGEFQAIQFKLADMAVGVRASRWLVLEAALQWGTDEDAFARAAAIAKLYATDMATRIATEAVQVLGGYGYLEDYPVARRFRDAKSCRLLGDSPLDLRINVGRHDVGSAP